MNSLALQILFLVAVTYQASCAPLSGGLIATRDHPGDNSASQNLLGLENELRESAKVQGPVHRVVLQGKIPLPQVQPTPFRTLQVAAGQVRGERERDESPARFTASVTDRQSQNSVEDNENVDSSASSDESAPKDTVPSVEDLSAVTEADLAEEEEFLRTIISTLRDNPELLKALIESDREEEEQQQQNEDFYKQKARVSDPDEFWGSFQRPSPQVQQMPKQVVKKAGTHVIYGGAEEKMHESPDNSLVNEDSEEQKSSKPIEVRVEADNADEHRQQSPKPLGSEKQGRELIRHQVRKANRKPDSDEQKVDDSHNNEQLRDVAVDETQGNHDRHFDEEATYSVTSGKSANRIDQQTDGVIQHVVPLQLHGDNAETELQALSNMKSQTPNARQAHPQM